MKSFKMTGWNGKSVYLGTISAESMREAEIFIAINFPEYFYGASISEVGTSDFVCICVKEYYKNEDGTYESPIKIALSNFDMRVKIDNGLCNVTEDWEGTTYIPYKTLSIPCK